MIRPESLVLPLLLVLGSASCSGSDSRRPVEVRVRNVSSVALEDVVVAFPDDPGRHVGEPVEPGLGESGDVDYGTVLPGEATAYRTIVRAYRYAPVTLTVDGREHRLQPDDYVGEELLEGGRRYTYELEFEDGTLLGIRLILD
ncbi:MAG: hypothetical protein PVI57_04140 [Gemmatimonadota bacterium]|jgi:hypothetical protein